MLHRHPSCQLIIMTTAHARCQSTKAELCLAKLFEELRMLTKNVVSQPARDALTHEALCHTYSRRHQLAARICIRRDRLKLCRHQDFCEVERPLIGHLPIAPRAAGSAVGTCALLETPQPDRSAQSRPEASDVPEWATVTPWA